MMVTERQLSSQKIIKALKLTRNRSAIKIVIITFFACLLLASCGGTETPERGFRSVRSIAGPESGFGEPFGIAALGDEIFVSDGQHGRIMRISGHMAPVLETDLSTPSGLAFDASDNLIVADTGSHIVKRIASDGTSAVVAGSRGDSGFADGHAAKFNGPVGVAVAPDGGIYVSDTYNDRIRSIGKDGSVRTVAGAERGFADGPGASAKFDTPLGIVMWGERLLVADAGNARIRVVEPDGSVWTLAGNGESALKDGFLNSASFVRPTAIAVAPNGVIYVADGNAIRAIGRRAFPFVETISDSRRGFRDGTPLAARFNRPSGLAVDDKGRLIVADSDNGLIRVFETDTAAETPNIKPKEFTAVDFRMLQPPRWPYDPPEAKRDIAGTLGEIRGEYAKDESFVRFHNGLDIAGAYGETARFLRDEKVLDPMSAENFGTLRELVRLPTIGYIHINLGRDTSGRTYDDPRFIFSYDPTGKMYDVRVPHGASFKAGEPVGALNAMNHVHMIAGPTGAEMNALGALVLPNVSDGIPPTIDKVEVFDENWRPIETVSPGSRITLSGKARITVRAHDRMDGNPERRKLGVYRVGYQMIAPDGTPKTGIDWTITFDRNPPFEAVKTVYAKGSKSGPTGETIFNYIVTNRLNAEGFGDGFLDAAQLDAGQYTVRVYAADFFGNQAFKDIQIEVIK